jgi:hypothetical protein
MLLQVRHHVRGLLRLVSKQHRGRRRAACEAGSASSVEAKRRGRHGSHYDGHPRGLWKRQKISSGCMGGSQGLSLSSHTLPWTFGDADTRRFVDERWQGAHTNVYPRRSQNASLFGLFFLLFPLF